jgi:hypothetical protein
VASESARSRFSLGVEFAFDGSSVSDRDQHTAASEIKAKLPNFRVIPDAGEKEIPKALRRGLMIS